MAATRADVAAPVRGADRPASRRDRQQPSRPAQPDRGADARGHLTSDRDRRQASGGSDRRADAPGAPASRARGRAGAGGPVARSSGRRRSAAAARRSRRAGPGRAAGWRRVAAASRSSPAPDRAPPAPRRRAHRGRDGFGASAVGVGDERDERCQRGHAAEDEQRTGARAMRLPRGRCRSCSAWASACLRCSTAGSAGPELFSLGVGDLVTPRSLSSSWVAAGAAAGVGLEGDPADSGEEDLDPVVGVGVVDQEVVALGVAAARGEAGGRPGSGCRASGASGPSSPENCWQ